MDARASAARVVRAVTVRGRSLNDTLPGMLQGIGDSRERALIQELSYGTLRWYYRLDLLLQQLLQRPLKQRDEDVRCLLLTGLYQLSQLAMPQRVAVNETVQATRALKKDWARGLVNGVLRNYLRQADVLEANINDSVLFEYAHPEWIVHRLQADWPNDWRAVLDANNQRPPFSLRVNSQRLTRDEYIDELAAHSIKARELPHTVMGIQTGRPVSVERLPGFAAGVVSVQDGAAQLAAGLLAASPDQRVLDACAAPGGKTAHIIERSPGLAQLTALDIDGQRLMRVQENLSRLSFEADLLQGDAMEPATWWDGQLYDRILLDAPCSATGVIRRHPDIKVLRQPGDVATLVSRQTQMLRALWPLLSPGGMLLYCTCSILTDENSRLIDGFLGSQADATELPIEGAWGHSCKHGRQILPGEDEMDGFYFACLRKLA